MKKRNFTATTRGLLLVSFMLLAGCSGEQEEAGVVEQASDKVAGKAMEYINKPLDKAKQSQAAQNVQTQNMEDVLEESGE